MSIINLRYILVSWLTKSTSRSAVVPCLVPFCFFAGIFLVRPFGVWAVFLFRLLSCPVAGAVTSSCLAFVVPIGTCNVTVMTAVALHIWASTTVGIWPHSDLLVDGAARMAVTLFRWACGVVLGSVAVPLVSGFPTSLILERPLQLLWCLVYGLFHSDNV